MAADRYTIGGTVQAGRGVYVRRQADDDLLACCLRGDYAYVLAPRQVGKSSLMVSVAQELEKKNVRSARVDLTEIGETDVSAVYCYRKILTLIADRIGLSINVEEWWGNNTEESINARFIAFFEGVVLLSIAESLVVFLDEIDFTLDWKFSDDFFAAIRYLYNARSQNAGLQRVSFVLLGVATPIDLVKDIKRTPFNIGTAIDVNDFSLEETLPLAAGLGLAPDATREVAEVVLSWTSGHPFLTQRLLSVLAGQKQTRWTAGEIDAIVHRVFLEDRNFLDHNLAVVARSLTKPGLYTTGMLQTYRKVLGRLPVLDDARSAVKVHLKLTGVVKRSHALLRVRNRIYETLFGLDWVREQRAIRLEQTMRQARALAAGLVILSLGLAGYTWYEHRQSQHSAEKAQIEAKLRQQADNSAEVVRAKNLSLSEALVTVNAQAARLREANVLETKLRQQAELNRMDALRSASRAELEAALKGTALESAKTNADKEAVSRKQAESSLEEKNKALIENQHLAYQLSAAMISASARDIAASETDSNDLGVLLGVEGYKRSSDNDSLNTLASTLDHLPRHSVVSQFRDAGVLALSDHGDELAVGDKNGLIRTFVVRSGQASPSQKLPAPVHLLAFSQGSVVAVDQKGDATGTLPSSKSSAARLRVSAIRADGNAYVTIEGDGKTVDYWTSGNTTPHKLTSREPCKFAAFSGDRLFVLCEGAVYLWKLPGFEQTRIEISKDVTDPVSGFAVYAPKSIDFLGSYFKNLAIANTHLLLMSGEAVSVYSVRPETRRTWPITHTIYRAVQQFYLSHESTVQKLVVSSSRAEVTTATAFAVRRWNLATGRETLRIYLPHRLSAIAVSSDDRWLATAETDGTLAVWMTSAGLVLSQNSPAENALSVLFGSSAFPSTNATSDQLAFSGDTEVWQQQGSSLKPWLWQQERSPDGLKLEGRELTRYLWMSEDGSHALRIPTTSASALLSKGNVPAQSPKTSMAVNYLNLDARTQVRIEVPTVIQASGLSANGIYFAIASGSAISVYKDGAVSLSVPFTDRATGLAVSPDGRITLAAIAGKVRILKDGTELESIKLVGTKNLTTSSLCFSRNGALFALAEGTQIRVFDTASMKEIKTITKVAAVSPAFSPDGAYLAAVSQGSVLIWNVDAIGKGSNADRADVPFNFIAPSAAPVTSLAFSRSGRYLATNSSDGLRVWYWRPSDIVAEACNRVRRADKKLSMDEWKNYIARNTKEPFRETATCAQTP